MTSMVDQISNLEMQTDPKFLDSSLVEALDLYHEWVKMKIVTPRENQLNSSGQPPKPLMLNTPSCSYYNGKDLAKSGVFVRS